MSKVLIMGGGGFIGKNLANYLTDNTSHKIAVADIKYLSEIEQDLRKSVKIFPNYDLSKYSFLEFAMRFEPDIVYQLAADMGGMGYIGAGSHDANIMTNSSLINLNLCKFLSMHNHMKPRVFYSSSACVYPTRNQLDPENPRCSEDSVYPADPMDEYGWEKLFSERLYKAYEKNYGLDVRIARFHNIYGPLGAYDGGKEKAPAALCRKIAEAKPVDTIEVWGSGLQTRSFLYIDTCIEGMLKLMGSDVKEIVNIGSEEMIAINDMAKMIADIASKKITIKNIDGKPIGVQGRNSDNRLIRKLLNWEPIHPLRDGLEKTYQWIAGELAKRAR